MKKFTLLKLLLVGAMAVVLYGQATLSAETAPAGTCPSFCFHLTCGGHHARCVNGQCVCP